MKVKPSLELQNILNKFNHIGYLDSKEVKKEVLKLNSISYRLDYLKELKKSYFDKYLPIFLNLSETEKEFQKEITQSIFGKHKLWTLLQIQKPIYDEFFKDLENKNTEYQFWFLKFSAEIDLKKRIDSSAYQLMMISNLKQDLIKAELKKIYAIEKKASKIVNKVGIDVYGKKYKRIDFFNEVIKIDGEEKTEWFFADKKRKYIEVFKVTDGNYYENNINITHIGNLPAENYFKHILYKQHLESLLGKETIIQKDAGSSKEKFTIENINKFENNLIPEIKLSDVYSYFKILLTSKNRQNTSYLNEEQLLIFIKSNFVDDKPILQKFNCKMDSKKDVRSLFYRFQKEATKYDYKTKNYKDKYFKILFKSFEGFDEIIDRKAWSEENNKIMSKLRKQG